MDRDIIICTLFNDKLDIDKLKEYVPTINDGYYAGRYYICIDIDEMDKMTTLIQMILDDGHRICMNDGTQITFNPGDTYSVENQQRKQLNSLKMLMDLHSSHALRTDDADYRWRDFDEEIDNECYISNEYWMIQEAQDFFRECFNRDLKLASCEPKRIYKFKDRYHFGYLWNEDKYSKPKKITSPTTSSTSSSSSSTNHKNKKSKIHEDTSDKLIPDKCMICCDNDIETIVYPCEHTVICESCSQKLKSDQSINRTQCIICRQKIESIYYIKTCQQIKVKYY